MSWKLEKIKPVLYGIGVSILLAIILYMRYYSGVEGFQATVASAASPTCSRGFTPDGKGSCVGYVCHGGPEKKRADGTNICSLPGGKTTPATLTKHPMICGKGFATVTSAAGVTTCVKI